MSGGDIYIRTKEGIQKIDEPIADDLMKEATIHADGSVNVTIKGEPTTCFPLFELSARATLDITDLNNRKLELTYSVSSNSKDITFDMPTPLFKPERGAKKFTLAEYRVLQTYKLITDLYQKRFAAFLAVSVCGMGCPLVIL